MATKLNRAVVRETADRDPCHGRVLMVRLEEGGRVVKIWEKGRRRKFTVTFADIWRFAFQAYARAEREERKQRRKKRGARK